MEGILASSCLSFTCHLQSYIFLDKKAILLEGNILWEESTIILYVFVGSPQCLHPII